MKDHKRAAEAAHRVLTKLGVSRLPVRPMEILRRCRHTRIMTFREAAEMTEISEETLLRMCADADAMTLRSMEGEQCRYLVCFREGGNPARLNFTLAHELGHIILRHRDNSPDEEAEADLFAECLLCPDPAVEMTKDPEVLARLCYVSRCTAEIARRRKMIRAAETDFAEMREYIAAFLRNGGRHPL